MVLGLKRRRVALLLFSVGCFLSEHGVVAERPKAPHLTIMVDNNGQAELVLPGHDLDGDKLTVQIESLPKVGALHFLNPNYVAANVEPKAGSQIVAIPSTIEDRHKHKVIYQAPKNKRLYGQVAEFRYTVSDGVSTSGTGIVRLVASNPRLVQSDFSDGSDGWRVVNNGLSSDVVHEQSSVTPHLNRFIHATDDYINIDPSTRNDKSLWYFSAPSKFLGFQAHAYKGTLEFSMGAFTGDFSPNRMNSDLDLVVLECETCALNRGMRFVMKLSASAFTGSPKKFSLQLSEDKWLKDPKNTLLAWSKPTACEFVEMLHSLSSIKILGDFTKFYESVALDDVYLTAPSGPTNIPITCLCSNPGTQCSY